MVYAAIQGCIWVGFRMRRDDLSIRLRELDFFHSFAMSLPLQMYHCFWSALENYEE